MKNILQNITVNSAHSITVNDTYFQSLTKAQILSIYDRTTGAIIVADTDVETKLTITNGNTITTDESLPEFIAGHTILMTVDAGLVGATGVVADNLDYRSKVAAATATMGQLSASASDTADQMALKIKAISTSINVTPIQGIPSTWHDLATEIANFYDVDNPYAFAILLDIRMKSVYLAGAAKYKLSDGTIIDQSSNPGNVTIGANTDATKKTNYIIYRSGTPNITPGLMSGAGGVNYGNGRIYMSYVYGANINQITYGGLLAGNMMLDTFNRTIPYTISGTRYNLSLSVSHFNGYVGSLWLPPFASDATDAERTLTFSNASVFSGCKFSELRFPEGAKQIYLTGTGIFANSFIKTLVIPDGCIDFSIATGTGNMSGAQLYGIVFPASLQTLNIGWSGPVSSFAPDLFKIYSNNLLTATFNSMSNSPAIDNSSIDFWFPGGDNLALSVSSNSYYLFGTSYGGSVYFQRVYSFYSIATISQGAPAYVYFAKPIQSFNYTGKFGALTPKIELESGWNFTFDFSVHSAFTGTNAYNLICVKLQDYRADGATTPTITADGTVNIVGTNTLFTKHHTGETIYINGVAKVFQTITDDTHAKMTTVVAAGTNVSYGANKTVTFHSTVKTALTSYNANWQTELTSKLWTVG